MINRSAMFSILKCEFGWNGCLPDGMSWEDIERLIAIHDCASCCANEVAIALAEHGACFQERIDGKPNYRRVIDGKVEFS